MNYLFLIPYPLAIILMFLGVFKSNHKIKKSALYILIFSLINFFIYKNANINLLILTTGLLAIFASNLELRNKSKMYLILITLSIASFVSIYQYNTLS